MLDNVLKDNTIQVYIIIDVMVKALLQECGKIIIQHPQIAVTVNLEKKQEMAKFPA